MMKHRRRMLLNLQKENLMKYAVWVSGITPSEDKIADIANSNGKSGLFYIEIQGGKTYKVRKKALVGRAFNIAFTVNTPIRSGTKIYGYVNNSSTQDVPLMVTAPTNCNYLVIRGNIAADGDIHEQLQNEILEVTEV